MHFWCCCIAQILAVIRNTERGREIEEAIEERRRASLRCGSASDTPQTTLRPKIRTTTEPLAPTLWSCRIPLRCVSISMILASPTTQLKLDLLDLQAVGRRRMCLLTTLPTRNIVAHHPRSGRSGASIKLPQAAPGLRPRVSYLSPSPPLPRPTVPPSLRTPHPTLTHLHKFVPGDPNVQGFQACSFRPTPPFLSETCTAEFSLPQMFTLQ
jgi:hypothetical protein